MAKTDLPAIASPGSQPLKIAKHEKYCRLRAALVPRPQAYREAGWNAIKDDDAYSNACQIERRLGVRERIEYLSRQAEDLIALKRQRLEAQLWRVHEADPGSYFETYEVAKSDKDGKLQTDEGGRMRTVKKQRPRLLSDLTPEERRCIEDVTVDRNGNLVPRLYSKAVAGADLRKMLNIGAQERGLENDVSRLSDVELVQQISGLAKQLGIEINLNYAFLQQAPPAATDVTEADGPRVVDVTPEVTAQPPATEAAVDTAAADAARDPRIGLNPAVAGARPVRKVR
jgi:hypothetical protein